MSELRVLCRVVTYDPATRSILLVRNRGQKWWCAPGGGWDHSQEEIRACAKREVLEETGVDVSIAKLLYAQTLLIHAQDAVWLEQFWLAVPAGSTDIPQEHIDHFGVVDEARWFSRSELEAVTVYPAVLKTAFWDTVGVALGSDDPYLGHFVL